MDFQVFKGDLGILWDFEVFQDIFGDCKGVQGNIRNSR